MKTYTVQRGDSLFLIAKKFYGDGEKYRQLAAYNGITNPNALEVGQVLSLPEESALTHPLGGWHNYRNGTVWWRVTAKGVEIKGEGYPKNPHYTQQVQHIWKTFQQPIQAASQKYHVPIPVILATISTESSGEPNAYRHEPAFYNNYIQNTTQWKNSPYHDKPKRISASYGLMQILYTTAYSVGFRGEPEDLYDPALNIEFGTKYIASDVQRKQHEWDPPKIACAYNAGSVRPTKKNPWGMHHYGNHLERWIPAYNGAIDILGTTVEPPEVIEQPPVESPPPKPPEDTATDERVTVRFVFPKKPGKEWKPVIVDVFKHTETGIGESVSFEIETVSGETGGGYRYELPTVAKGIYDFVFTDAASSSVINDVAEVMIDDDPTIIDLREDGETAPGTAPETASGTATLRIRFPKVPGLAWKPVIIDLFKHGAGGVGKPMSTTANIPEHGPDGGDIYDISGVEYGVYDVVFTDAKSQSVIDDVSDYEVTQPLVTINLRASARSAPPAETAPPGLLDRIAALWKSLWA